MPVSAMASMERDLKAAVPTAYPLPVNSQKPLAVFTGT